MTAASDPSASQEEPAGYFLGPFRLDVAGEMLLQVDGDVATPITIGRRAVAVLRALVARPMALVTKEELFAAAWPGLAVEDSNLAVQIAALRKALSSTQGGAKWIETRARRGYRYVGEVVPYYAQPSRPVQEAPPPPRAYAAPLVRQGPPGLAVLPFRSTGDGAADAYFGDGIVEEIVAALSSLRVLTVISRNSTLAYRGLEADLRRTARELNVRYVVSGSVRRERDRLRVSTELADCDANAVLWARSYDSAGDRIFDTQDSIAHLVSSTIVPQISIAELLRLRRKRPDNMDAYDLVLRARELMHRMVGPDLTAQEVAQLPVLLGEAVQLDPGYASAFVLLAEWHTLRVGQGLTDDPLTDSREADRLAQEALRRDPTDPFALAIHGHTRSFLFRDYDGAMELFARAIEASPSSATAWGTSSCTFNYVGRTEEAIERANHALRLSPFDPRVYWYQAALTQARYLSGQYEAAIETGRVSLQAAPRYTATLRLVAASLAALGHTEEAREMAARLLACEPHFHVASYLDQSPIQDKERRSLFGKHLLAAGLPL